MYSLVLKLEPQFKNTNADMQSLTVKWDFKLGNIFRNELLHIGIFFLIMNMDKKHIYIKTVKNAIKWRFHWREGIYDCDILETFLSIFYYLN